MAHTCSTLVLHCIDFRLGNAIKEYLEKNNYLGDCDIVSVAGAAKNIASPADTSARVFVLNQIAISKRLHNISRVVLMNHTDCGAYGGTSAFASDEAEKEHHRSEMMSARTIIHELHPELNISLALAHVAHDNVRIEAIEA